MANNNIVNKKRERNTFLTRFLITSDVDDIGVRRDGDDDDPAADVSNGDDNNDEDTDALAGNTAADGECDEGDGNGKINVKGDCDIDCNRAECWRIFNC